MFTFTFMIAAFVIGYTVIALEHPLKINKTATALLLGVLLWVCAVVGGEGILVNSEPLHNYMMNNPGSGFIDWLVHSELLESLGEISEILFFLMGAMSIVEIVDVNGGFKVITDRISTTKKTTLLWIICTLTFFMSAVLDNLTTSIVMVALLRKLLGDRKERWIYASMVILAANAGGAWSPIGDVTTIMLWIAGDVSSANIILQTFVASAVSILVPLAILSFMLKGNVTRPEEELHHVDSIYENKKSTSLIFLCVGVGALICVPIFKTLTHLPPYIGMLGGLGILWITSEIIHRKPSLNMESEKSRFSIMAIISRIDLASILFFLGILLAVNALRVVGHLSLLSNGLDSIPMQEPGKYYVINIIIGVLSSIVDNVPLVAGAMGMYHFPIDHYFWEMLAYCAGTGGSILIIGSAAGVAVMGLEKIDFIWYLKHISWLALVGYLCGAGVFIAQKAIINQFGAEEKAKTENVVPMTVSAVEDYLFDNTFYMSADVPENDSTPTPTIKDSITMNLVSYTREEQQMLGLRFKEINTDLKNNRIINIVEYSEWEPGAVQVDMEDTTAIVHYGNKLFQVTKQGQLIQWNISPYGIDQMEWKRK